MLYYTLIIIGALFSATCLAAEQNLLLTQTAIGPIDQNTPFDQRVIQNIFPYSTVKKTINVAEGESSNILVVYNNKKPLLTIAPVDAADSRSKILCVSFTSNVIQNSLGAKIGSRYASVYSDYNQPRCMPGLEEMSGLVICSAPNANNIDYVFAGDWNGPDGQIPPLAVLKNWTIKQITWLTDEKYSLKAHLICKAIVQGI